ncbi:tyrosine-type recombinase/integrase [Gracilibacillus alcaliphilus]|uniref:tyrosine-type recombinase/integrase n=1 Tax=Gracilibacillus alcaliphilus TaxID=1401441 RepID=UPI00195C27B1|nr:tyrosine-type recombinase/integrase [Gracilibacillus alcaliphilus]MBM7679673.1 integrase [Gracilibacillus alcaliphilus]
MIKKIIHIKKQELFKAGDKREWKDHTFLFSNEFGKPLRPDSISQWWIRFKESDKFKTLGLESIRFHDLRHSSLTFLSSRGLRLKKVQDRAGHAKMGTTFDIYGHSLPEEDFEAAGYVEEMFQPN